ncbi:hypothetical protein [Halalkalicoccus salilacus]|uniref:hypothetical protein n=1 Tax=Halalkalicoccus salilacus TaxID=3117459 RepID=UPI00300EE693
MDSDSDETSDRPFFERIQNSEVRLWLLMRLNRWVLVGGILVVVFTGLVGGTRLGLDPFRALVANHGAMWWIFSNFIGAIITGVTLVVTLNQLVLSQELGAVGEQRDRMQASMDFRQDIEDTIDLDVSPPEPAAFMKMLVDRADTQAEDLRDVMEDERDEELKRKVNEYVDDLTENADEVSERLDDAQFGTFDVIWAIFRFNYSWKIFSARQIRNEHEDSFSGEADEKLDNMIEILKLFGPAREHFKTLYFQWELIKLSNALLYISIPVLIVIGLVLMYLGPGAVPGTFLGLDNLTWVAAAAYTIGLAPFVVLLSYILRIGTMAKRTLAIGPFILREAEREDDIDWSS